MMPIYWKWHLKECFSDYKMGMFYFSVSPNAGNRNNPSHNNDTLTRWLIRCQLDELSLGNMGALTWWRVREGSNEEKMSTWQGKFKNTRLITPHVTVNKENKRRWLKLVTGGGCVTCNWRQRPHCCLVWASCWNGFHSVCVYVYVYVRGVEFGISFRKKCGSYCHTKTQKVTGDNKCFY